MRSHNTHKLIDALFEVPLTSVPNAADLTGITYEAAKAHVQKLIALKILDGEHPLRYKGVRYYFARQTDCCHRGASPNITVVVLISERYERKSIAMRHDHRQHALLAVGSRFRRSTGQDSCRRAPRSSRLVSFPTCLQLA